MRKVRRGNTFLILSYELLHDLHRTENIEGGTDLIMDRKTELNVG